MTSTMQVLPPRLFKVVTLSIHRTHQLIEAQSDSEALALAHQLSQSGPIIEKHSVITVTGAGRGGYRNG